MLLERFFRLSATTGTAAVEDDGEEAFVLRGGELPCTTRRPSTVPPRACRDGPACTALELPCGFGRPRAAAAHDSNVDSEARNASSWSVRCCEAIWFNRGCGAREDDDDAKTVRLSMSRSLPRGAGSSPESLAPSSSVVPDEVVKPDDDSCVAMKLATSSGASPSSSSSSALSDELVSASIVDGRLPRKVLRRLRRAIRRPDVMMGCSSLDEASDGFEGISIHESEDSGTSV